MQQESNITKKSKLWWRWSVFVGVFLISVLLGIPMLLVTKHVNYYWREAEMNANQIGKGLFSFEQEFGAYPNERTLDQVLRLHPEAGPLLDTRSSNGLFRQLLLAGLFDQESCFASVHHVGDNLIDGGKMLERGETHFSYVVWESSADLPDQAPLVMIPLEHGKRKFDGNLADEYFSGRVVILHRDYSVKIYRLNHDGCLLLNGKDFFDWSQPHWGGLRPRIAWPE